MADCQSMLTALAALRSHSCLPGGAGGSFRHSLGVCKRHMQCPISIKHRPPAAQANQHLHTQCLEQCGGLQGPHQEAGAKSELLQLSSKRPPPHIDARRAQHQPLQEASRPSRPCCPSCRSLQARMVCWGRQCQAAAARRLGSFSARSPAASQVAAAAVPAVRAAVPAVRAAVAVQEDLAVDVYRFASCWQQPEGWQCRHSAGRRSAVCWLPTLRTGTATVVSGSGMSNACVFSRLQ